MEELQAKIDNIIQMLPREQRIRRGVLSLGGKALKFLFGAALSEDLDPLNAKIENLRTRVGELVHDATQHMTISREIDFRVRNNAKVLLQMAQTMKSRTQEMIHDQFALEQQVNRTREQIASTAQKASYVRELETLCMKIYADITSLTLSLDIATLHKLTASLLPAHKMFAILRDIHIHLDQCYALIAALKPENMHLFYASSEIAVLATSEAIRLIVQIPLRTEKRTYMVYHPVTLPTFQKNLGKFIQIRVGKERLAISHTAMNF